MLASWQLWLYVTLSTRTFGISIQSWETPTPVARVNYFLSITRNKGKYIMLCTHFYIMFNKLHDKKHHQYKPIPLITSYLLNPEQPSPFVTIWALITSTWWPKKITSWYIELCNYTFQKYFIVVGGLHLFWCCHLKPALHFTYAVVLFLLLFFLIYIF